MVRDPVMEDVMRKELGGLPGLAEKPMFGGLCFLQHGHMICAIRQGRAMYRVGKSRDDKALALSGTTLMIRGGRAMPGYVWLHDDQLSNDATRARLTAWALDHARDLPPRSE